MASAAPLVAQTSAFSYQGHLTDQGASANGSFDMSFTLMGSLTGATPVTSAIEIAGVPVNSGLFSVVLDFGAASYDGSARYLEISVRETGSGNPFTVLTPRQEVTASPYAVRSLVAESLNGAVTASNIAPGTITASMLDADVADSQDTPDTLVERDANGDFSARVITAERIVTPASTPAPSVIPANGMRWIEPGSFIMGSRLDELQRDTDEGPQTFVTLTQGFWMSVHEVTQAEYEAVTGQTPSNFAGTTFLEELRPVESVSWVDAVAYCTSLTASERTAGRIPNDWAYRLPTEAEWEYASRAGASSTRFSFGDDLAAETVGDYAWWVGNAGGTTHPVATKLPNPWGLMDMHGNVWEWCADYYSAAYPGGSVVDPSGPSSGSQRVLRGGAYSAGSNLHRSASRISRLSTFTSSIIGFRVVLSPVLP